MGDNGGATYKGVTRDEITVVIPNYDTAGTGIMNLYQSRVSRIPFLHEAMAALLLPVLKIRRGDAVRPSQKRIRRIQELDRRKFVDYLLRI